MSRHREKHWERMAKFQIRGILYAMQCHAIKNPDTDSITGNREKVLGDLLGIIRRNRLQAARQLAHHE